MLVSVVIPVRNAEPYLPACLEQLIRQTYPHEKIEVIIADGLSTDRTVQVAENYDIGKITRKVIRCPSMGRSQGLNLAIKAATGHAICRLDARTMIAPDYIDTCVKTLLETGAANVGGLQVPRGDTTVQTAIGLAMSHPFGAGNAQFRIAKKSGYVDTVYLGFYRRDIFQKVGYFDEEANVISEDSDMNQRIRESGEKIYLNVSLRAQYAPRATLREQFALYFRYGGARAGNLLKHRGLTSWRQMAAPALVALLLLLPFAGFYNSRALYAWASVALLYAFANVIVALAIALKARNSALAPRLFAAFPTMHLSYGLGFWWLLLGPKQTNRPWKG